MTLEMDPLIQTERIDEAVLELRPRRLGAAQVRRMEAAAAEILALLGLDLGAPDTAETPHRFIHALIEATEGFEGDRKFLKTFEAEKGPAQTNGRNQIIEGPIPFFALCEHHVLPFQGEAYLGYIADKRLIGISKLTRLVRIFARRLTLQERLGRQIADALEAILRPRGVAVYLEAQHTCTQMRGVKETVPVTRTTVWRGAYDSDPTRRSEFLSLCRPR